MVLDDADLVSGEAIAAVALRPADPDDDVGHGPGGHQPPVPVGVGVDGDDLVAVRSAAPMAGPRNHACSPMADRSAREGERRVLGPATDLDAVLDRWKVLTAAALIGVADGALRLGVEYVMAREQFGVPIGSFQAVQHGMADLPVLIDGGRLLTHKAAWAIDSGTDLIDWRNLDITDGPTLASMAFVFASDAAAHATDRSLHYHGGYGFAEEYDVQLYYRRARGWALVHTDVATETLHLADRLLGTQEG
jgi:alkylation response protein AidB-like acyl-CoA dehydrogenase